MVALALSATRDLLSRRTYLPGQQKRAGKMTARRRREMMTCIEGGVSFESDYSESTEEEWCDSD